FWQAASHLTHCGYPRRQAARLAVSVHPTDAPRGMSHTTFVVSVGLEILPKHDFCRMCASQLGPILSPMS
ncbi:MAG: hypothetical protein MN733_11160, partial [Nitrososphaera sp.]|nr:hypothetical protein [Nitrososphaera sp.]